MNIVLEGGPYDGLEDSLEILPSFLHPEDSTRYVRVGLVRAGRHVYRHHTTEEDTDE